MASQFSVMAQLKRIDRRSSVTMITPPSVIGGSGKTATVVFTIDAGLKFGSSLKLIGNCQELGHWNLSRGVEMRTDAQKYPRWESHPISFELPGDEGEFEYKFVEIEARNSEFETFQGNRRLKCVLKMTDSMECSVHHVLHVPSNQEVNSLLGYSLLTSLDSCDSSVSKVTHLLNYLTRKGRDISLKDLVSVCFFFKKMSSEEAEEDENEAELCSALVLVVKALYRVMTEEVQPVVMKTVVYMGRCCQSFREQMKSIANAKQIHKHQLDIGCQSEALENLLEELFSSSPKDDMGLIRVIVLNSIRSVLKSLHSKSTKPEFLVMYEVWIALLQKAYIERQFLASDTNNVGNLLHQVAICSEHAALSSICAEELKLAEGLSSTERMEDVRKVLVQMIDCAVLWMSRYVTAASRLGKGDLLRLGDFLIGIGAESVELLIPVISRALHAVSISLGRSYHLSLCPGKAIGKVLRVESLEDVSNEFSSVIAVVPSSKTLAGKIPSNITGIVQVGDSYISSQLVAHCLMKKIVLGVVADDFREGLKGKVELRVDSIKVLLL